MHSSQLLTALAVAGFASAKTCTKDIEVTEPTPVIDCDVVKADIIIDESLDTTVSLEGVKQIQGDLIVKNSSISGLTSSSINAISGKFVLQGCQFLRTLRMDSLTDVSEIEFTNLNALGGLTFGSSGQLKIDKITISDTHIDDLSGLNVVTVEDFLINNNARMKSFSSDLVNITGSAGLRLEGNGKDMQLDLPELEMATELQFQDIKSISLPSLKKLNQSLKLDDNRELTDLSAPNLTEIGEALSLINNRKLSNVSFPKLETIGGDLTIVNNTAMLNVSGFPKLETIDGGIRMGGKFEDVELPSLQNVEGSSNVTSTTDIAKFCEFFDKAADDGILNGKAKCTSDNEKALEGGDGGKENDGSSSGSDDEDDDDAAGILNVNMAVLSLAVVFGVAQLL
ncbi:hypothetical protein LIA77_11284 [Sarocladium implicatum]|nr:hypothetical protein LIA77_11284 [Sarocladium implicatum]